MWWKERDFAVGPGGKFSESSVAKKDPNLEVWGFLLCPSLAAPLWEKGGVWQRDKCTQTGMGWGRGTQAPPLRSPLHFLFFSACSPARVCQTKHRAHSYI